MILGILAISSCKESSEMVNDAPEISEENTTKYAISAFSSSPEFADAAMTSMDFSAGKFNFGVGGDSYVLGTQTTDAESKMCANSAKGQHIHLIVDNGPYAAKYTADFDYEIADGEHYILAFLSRSYHESIKTTAAHKAEKVTISGNAISDRSAVTEPMLFYSRPKGTYVGADTKKVMLDFYLSNTNLASSGNKVKADINGEVHMIDKWQPYYVEGMPMGENTITLTLVDNDGKTIDTPMNPVTRTFTLKEDPAPAK